MTGSISHLSFGCRGSEETKDPACLHIGETGSIKMTYAVPTPMARVQSPRVQATALLVPAGVTRLSRATSQAECGTRGKGTSPLQAFLHISPLEFHRRYCRGRNTQYSAVDFARGAIQRQLKTHKTIPPPVAKLCSFASKSCWLPAEHSLWSSLQMKFGKQPRLASHQHHGCRGEKGQQSLSTVCCAGRWNLCADAPPLSVMRNVR